MPDDNKDKRLQDQDEIQRNWDALIEQSQRSAGNHSSPKDLEDQDVLDEIRDGTKEESTVSGSRLERLQHSRQARLSPLLQQWSIWKDRITGMTANMKSKQHKKKKRYRINKARIATLLVSVVVVSGLIVGGLTVSVVMTSPSIEPDNIYTLLAENSVLYDDQGNSIESLTSEGLRTNITYDQLPEDLTDAFIAIEDKTFEEHNGFNVVRIFGAVIESVTKGGTISGTSTITQQLARNLYLAETKSVRSMTRKIREAYYTVLLEKQLTKEQILEAYLNTISLGNRAYGVQAASQVYFSKNVEELTLAESAVLASLPKAPSKYAPLKTLANEQVEPNNPNIVAQGDQYTVLYDDTVKERQELVLRFMLDQGRITQAEYDEAMAVDLRQAIRPSMEQLSDISSYFADYVVNQVISDLTEQNGMSEEDARSMIYNGGLRIYTTLSIKMQQIAEKEFSNNANFPQVRYGSSKDQAGNLLDSQGKVLLYAYSSLFDENGRFTLTPEEYQIAENGDLILLKGKRLAFYKTEVQGDTDYSVEFKGIYTIEDKIFYSMNGGTIMIPAEYKKKDDDGNLIVSQQIFTDKPELLQFGDLGITVDPDHYVLKEKIQQPQGAMVILDYKSGGIKAMVGGRSIKGKLLYNRATSTRQPGSAIKPIGVYGPAIESGALEATGLTAATILDDAPNMVNGELWPKNSYEGYKGLVTARRAMEQSMNVPAVKLFTQVGPARSLAFLKKVGITSVVESGESNDMNAAALGLGGMTKGISPLEIAAAYGTFGNGGNYTEPIAYTKVTNKQDDVILERAPKRSKAMEPGTAFILTDMLRTTVTNGIAGSAAIGSHVVGGKTGTTSDNYDAWFVGITPQYAASVWIGNDVNIELSSGSGTAARLWSKIMGQCMAGLPAGSFPVSDAVETVNIDTISGMLPSDLSAMDPRGTVKPEYFVKGTAPTAVDSYHVAVTVCNTSGYLVTPYCPATTYKVAVKRPYAADPLVGDIAYEAPEYYCHLHNNDASRYPIAPGKTLDPFYTPGLPSNPENNGTGNGNNNGNNGNGNGQPPVIDSNPFQF